MKATLLAISKATPQANSTSSPANTQEASPKAKTTATTHALIKFGSLLFTVQMEDNQLKEVQQTNPNTTVKNLEKTFNPADNVSMLQPHLNQQTNQFQQKGKDSKTVNRVTASTTRANRFVRPPPATANWQGVGSKRKSNNSKFKQCFFCQKKGHIQRYCWKKLKCFKCGEIGHKYAHCSSQNPHNPPAQQSNLIPQPTSHNMEHIHGRPSLQDIYCPPRNVLDENNDYLSTIGLIILINGSQSVSMPRMIADSLATAHGRHPSEFQISQASIAPYLVTCRSTQARDALVRRGHYYIPQTGTRFTVHEWRPRFRMGHDPPTHQVWVKLVGLPLQAWSTPEISDILRRFGHPVHIMPFGHLAGHYRDIVALVDTGHPSLIPHAYTYREGDYSTQLDVLILSWRLWTPGFFPPPGSPTDQRNNRAPTQPHNRLSNPVDPRDLPSSSSSNGDPSEPTIDYSSWSPRSYQIRSTSASRWTPKITQSNKPPENLFAFLSISKTAMLAIADRTHQTATIDPTSANIFLGTRYTRLFCLIIPAPHQILINPLCFLTTLSSDSLIVGKARKN